jgi:hypothetical protein
VCNVPHRHFSLDFSHVPKRLLTTDVKHKYALSKMRKLLKLRQTVLYVETLVLYSSNIVPDHKGPVPGQRLSVLIEPFPAFFFSARRESLQQAAATSSQLS